MTTWTKAALAGLVMAVGVADGTRAEAPAAKTSDVEREKIETIVHDYLLKHPEVLLEALQELDKKQAAEKAAKAKDVIAKDRKALTHDGYSAVIGNPNGDLTVVEVYDYNCGYCRLMADEIKQLIKGDPKIRIVLKDWPIRGPASLGAAKVSLAAAKQKKFATFHFALLETEGTIDEARALEVAKTVGLDMGALQRDMKALKADALLAKNAELVRRLGIDGTPGFIIGDTIIPGATELDSLKRVVADARAACKKAATC